MVHAAVAVATAAGALSFLQPPPGAGTGRPQQPPGRVRVRVPVAAPVPARRLATTCALNRRSSETVIGGSGAGGIQQPNSNYVVPLDSNPSAPSCITRPLAEILRDLNKRVPDGVVRGPEQRGGAGGDKGSIPWYHANRLLSFYAPGWCGEVRNVIILDNGKVTVVYRVTVRGSDGEAHRDSTGTVTAKEGRIEDAVAAAEELAFCRACARFGLGLYLYHEDEAL